MDYYEPTLDEQGKLASDLGYSDDDILDMINDNPERLMSIWTTAHLQQREVPYVIFGLYLNNEFIGSANIGVKNIDKTLSSYITEYIGRVVDITHIEIKKEDKMVFIRGNRKGT